MTKEEHTTTNIKVPNKNMDVLKKHFSHCFTKDGEFNINKFKEELSENEVDFHKESYGMDWLGKSYARLLATDEATTLLKENEAHNLKPENKDSQNLLIKGDNLEVLKHLSNAYHEKVKMIYIDPPYNTGSDGFVYNDDRKFTVDELKHLAGVNEDKAKRILEFTKSNSNSHSAWLTFMYPRLYIAKQLLKDDGVIFISIDDNEVSQLRVLMDEVFGEENFVCSFMWKRKKEISNDSKNISIQGEYIISYSKTNATLFKNESLSDAYIKKSYKEPNSDFPEGKWRPVPITVSKGLSGGGYEYEIVSPNNKKHNKVWAYPKESFEKLKKEELVYWGEKGDAIPQRVMYAHKSKGQPSSNYWDDTSSNKEGKKRIIDLFGDNVFDTAKPSELICRLISLVINNDEIILDFFAGSGTTADAIMQMNTKDGGARKFILAQLPELINEESKKVPYNFVKEELGIEIPTIFEITKERLIRSVNKIQEDNKHLKEPKDLSQQDFGFKIFETTPIWEDYYFEANELDKQVSLFDESKLTEEDLKSLLVTWKTYDGIELTEDLIQYDLAGYKSHLANGKLYLVNKGFSTDSLKALLEKVDDDKTFNPTSIIAFGYHFESKSLREIGENIKSYANKKNIDIDFITRY